MQIAVSEKGVEHLVHLRSAFRELHHEQIHQYIVQICNEILKQNDNSDLILIQCKHISLQLLFNFLQYHHVNELVLQYFDKQCVLDNLFENSILKKRITEIVLNIVVLLDSKSLFDQIKFELLCFFTNQIEDVCDARIYECFEKFSFVNLDKEFMQQQIHNTKLFYLFDWFFEEFEGTIPFQQNEWICIWIAKSIATFKEERNIKIKCLYQALQYCFSKLNEENQIVLSYLQTRLQKETNVVCVLWEELELHLQEHKSNVVYSQIIHILANLSYRNRENQDLATKYGTVLQVLLQYPYSKPNMENPFLKEYTLLLFKYLCEKNEQVQQLLQQYKK